MFEAALSHERTVAGAASKAARKAVFQWRQVNGSQVRGSWAERLPGVVAVVAGFQSEVALDASLYGAGGLVESGEWVAPEVFVNPSGFAGFTGSGAPLATVLERPTSYALGLIAQGVSEAEALRRGGLLLGNIVKTQIQDTARAAASVDIQARSGVGYTRVVGPGSCSRCIILAGKWFRWNQGFKRHPNCNCTHQPTGSKQFDGALSEGFIDDPYKVFQGLSPAEQDKAFGAANAAAIREGSDIFQVVNSSRGASGLRTTAGTSKRGYSSGLADRRLTPEGIYTEAQGNKARARELLIEHNYILPGGQNPQGSIRGQDFLSFGAMGRGGTRVGMSADFRRAVETGVRNPNSLATMTAAERRLAQSKLRWDAVLEGRNPFNKNRPLTPEIAARVERDYKRWLATGGEKFIN